MGEHKGYRQEPKPLTDAEKRALSGVGDLSRGSGGSGKLGCLMKLLVVALVLGAPIAAVAYFQPWDTTAEHIPISSDLCTDDERAMQFRERLYVFGFEVRTRNRGVVCVPRDGDTN